jgi:spermidine synthase
VVDTGDDLQLRLDNYYVLGGSAAATNERRQGLLPLLLHPAPHRVAFVGMATGITASAGPALGVERTVVVELVPEVAAAAAAHFGAWNAALLRRPDVHLVVDDGRRWLAASAERWDVVVSDLFIPWHAGASSLYGREMFETVARRLSPGGLFCQWLPLYQLTREEFDAIARTFLAVFPDASLWRNDFYPDRPVVGLIGQLAPRTLDLDRVGERLAALPEWSRDPLLATPQGLGMLHLGDLAAARALIANGPLNTDDRPLIEFLAPRLTRMSAAGDKDWFTGEALAAFTDDLAERPGDLLPATQAVAAARRAGASLYRYALAARRGDEGRAARYEAEVRELVPEVVALGERASSVATLADARRTLGTLRTEQERVARELEAMERRLSELAGPRGDDP